MFKPGSYNVDVPVGYYTHIIGLGDSPDDVVFNGPKGVYVDAGSYDSSPAGDCLSNFWRAAEGALWVRGSGVAVAVEVVETETRSEYHFSLSFQPSFDPLRIPRP